MPIQTNQQVQRWFHFGLACLLALIVVSSAYAAQRGAGPRGAAPTPPPANNANRGGPNGATAQARQQIQAELKAAIASAEATFRLAMASARLDAKSDDATARSHAQIEMQQAQLNRKTAIGQARTKANAALAALKNQ